jgi:hypothetical protein
MRAPEPFSLNFLFLHIPKTEWWELEGPSEKSNVCYGQGWLMENNVIEKECWLLGRLSSLVPYCTSYVSLGRVLPLSGHVSSFIK